MLFRSLTLRLGVLSAVWVALGLTLAGWLVLGIATEQVRRSFDSRVTTLLDTVAGVAVLGPDGRPRLERAVSEPNFGQPFSGIYWQVATPAGARAGSRSLWDAVLPGYDRAEGPGPRLRDAPGPRGERLRLAEREVVLPDSPAPLLVQVAVARGAMDGEVRRLRLLLAVAFGVLGIGLVAGVAGQVVWGLRPLRRARDALAEVRAGNRARLAAVAMPSEIAPLLEEIDALIEQNHATVERARAHVGNLAHALKTPIAIQRGALDTAPPDLPTALAQNRAMERLVQHHLTRARAAAMAGAAAAESVPHAVGEELARVLRRLFQDRGIAITVEGDRRVRVRVDQQDLTEMLGNLMENACKWAGSTVTLEVAREAAEVVVAIADDGPGLTGQQRAMALARGVRLDEAAPGSGLGLAIVADLAALYGGSLTLKPASLGGLRAVLRLPGR